MSTGWHLPCFHDYSAFRAHCGARARIGLLHADLVPAGEASLINTVGASIPRKPDTIFARQGIRYIQLPDKEIAKMAAMCASGFDRPPWDGWREALNQMAGGIDVLPEIFRIAREIPADALAENIPARRWWKG